MKNRMSMKMMTVILSVVLLVAATVGVTVAFLVDKTPSTDKTFVPVYVSCKVQETMDRTTNTKTDVAVQNTCDIPAYVRVAIVVTWVSEESGSTYGGAPVDGRDYVASFSDNGWIKGTDGFYYCTSPVAAEAVTPVLLRSIAPVDGKAPEGYVLSVQVVASAIQAEPAEAVTSAWKTVTVHNDGTIVPQ